jgi:hypothetical protein
MTTQTLTGSWQLAVDPGNGGRAERWFAAVRPEAQSAPVPGIVQQLFPTHQGVAWYWHAFTPPALPSGTERARLRFGAVEYLADVWLNGVAVGGHEGAETLFELDVTGVLRPGENLLAVRVLMPGDAAVDGLTLADIPHRNQFDHARFQPGMSFNLNALRVLEHLGRHPAAGRLLLNLVTAARHTEFPAA